MKTNLQIMLDLIKQDMGEEFYEAFIKELDKNQVIK